MSKTLKSWLILLLLAVIWGSSYWLIKKSLIAFNPFQVASLRIGIAALAFLPFFLFKLKNIQKQEWKFLAVVGLLGSGIPSFLFPIAQTEISSSLAGVLSSLTPLFTLVLAVLMFGMTVARRNMIGIAIGFLGAAGLIVFGKSAFGSGNNWYGLWIVFGCVFYGLSANTVKRHLQNMNALTLSSAAFAMLLPFALFGFWFTDVPSTMQSHPEAWTSLGYLAGLSLAGTFFASVVFFWLVQLTNAVFASSVSYLTPIVALLLGTLDGELISFWHFFAMGLILVGVYLSRE